MSEMQPEGTQGSEETTPVTGEAPYANYLTELPDSVRPLVEPLFKQWDADVTKRFQSLHSTFEPLKPYEEIQQAGWTPEDIQGAIQLAAALNENPQAIYDALVENYGFGKNSEQGQADPAGLPDEDEDYVDPRIAQLEQQQQVIADFILQQENAKQAAKEDAELAAYLNKLKEDFGDYDVDYVQTKMYSGMSGEDAVKQYQGLVAQAAQSRPNPPVIMGAGGGLPSQTINPAQMSDKDRKALITQMLAQANQAQ